MRTTALVLAVLLVPAGCAWRKAPAAPIIPVQLLEPSSIQVDTKNRRLLIDPCGPALRGWKVQVGAYVTTC